MKTIIASILLAMAALPAWSADVLTHHNDNARTGANLLETNLTPAKVNTNTFGKLFSRRVAGQIYAQPLVVSGVEIPGHVVSNVVYVATMQNIVYAFDADNAQEDQPFWKTEAGPPVPYQIIPDVLAADFLGFNIEPYIGITSTPVIDPAGQEMWVATKTFTPPDEVHYWLKCLDIRTGNVLRTSPDIQTGNGEGKLEAKTALQRPALLLANGTIYLAFGSHQDAGHYHGWIVGFDTNTLQQTCDFCTTPGNESGEGGIWQSGQGPAADDEGNIYFMTGNGDFDGKHQFGDSFVKLGSKLELLDWFTPWNYQELTDGDLDLGSSGPLLLPGSHQLVGGGKQGYLYLLDRRDLGKLQHKHATAPALQEFKVSDHWTLTWISWLLPSFGYHHIHGGAVYWNSAINGPLVYIWPEETRLKAFKYDPQQLLQKKPLALGPKAPKGMPGGFMSISANGDHDGLLWTTSPLKEDALTAVVSGVMRVFDANTLKQLWNTEQEKPRDSFNFAKDCPPTIANGKVYLATFSDRLNVYGLFPPSQPRTNWTKIAAPPKPGRGTRHKACNQ